MAQDYFYRCIRCLLPNTKPDLELEQGKQCGACNYTDYYNQIDWAKRESELLKKIEKIKDSRTSQSTYDCAVAVSGGKDSTYITYIIKEKLGLNALLLNFEPTRPTELGKKNLNNLRENFGFDLLEMKKNKNYRKLAKIGFDIVGDHDWPNHVGIYCWPLSTANQMKIPFTFYGEPRGVIGLGQESSFYGAGAELVTRNFVEQYVGMNGFRLNDFIKYDPTLSLKELQPYIFPNHIEQDIVGIELGNFFKWNFYDIVEIIKKYGWEEGSENEGTFTKNEDIDCGFMRYHQYFKYIKYGYRRATDDASYQIRNSMMNMKKAKELIINFDTKRPKKYFQEFLDYLNISEEQFYKKVDQFANKKLFEYNENKQEFIRDSNNDLIPNKVWKDSFSD
mgnify:CR=1 FL=1|tara:strand:- start:2983 stop:4158 length:1176 start_codon:yes stop_codon:yes gene_type:complete